MQANLSRSRVCRAARFSHSPHEVSQAHGLRTASFLLCLMFFSCAAQAQGFRVTGIQVEGGQVWVDHESNLAAYHILKRVDLSTRAETPVAMAAGVAGAGRLLDRAAPSAAAYYRVTRIPNDNPLDSDGDGMDDLYEIARPGLNPLDASDAGRVDAGTGRTNLEDYYRDESNLALYPYLVGRGMHDVTGPAADGGMMGYAEADQRSEGIHDRQWARAFVAAGRGNNAPRVVFVVVDTGQIFHSITQGVQDRLQADEELAPYYSHANIVLSATHTHGGAGGHSHHVLYNLTIGGFAWQTYDAMVHGIYMAIKKAHRNLAPGRIVMNKGSLDNANENRQADGFQQNPEVAHPAMKNPFGTDNRDTEMVCLRFEHSNRREIGMFNWFPVHGVSFSKQNRLLTGDNKGYAAYLFETSKGAKYPGNSGYSGSSGFVAGFANSNPGDMTANRRNLESGWPENGKDDEGRATMIGERQFKKAVALYDAPTTQQTRIFGAVDYRHMYVAITSVEVNPPDLYPYNVPEVGFPDGGPPRSTYIGALGVDFARGTLDGEAMSEALIDAFRVANNIIPDPVTDEFELRHAPKEVLLTTGTLAVEGMTWTPQVVPISILRIGNFAILSVPGEFTCMAGSRLRRTVESILGPGVHTVLAGLANDYTGYITTFEEYIHETGRENGVPNQSYEAASTQFGGFTLAAYQTKFAELARSLVEDTRPVSAPMPRTQPPVGILLKALDPILDLPPLPPARPALFKGPAGCPAGQFLDIGTGFCWSCPEGYNRTVFSVEGSTACEKPASSLFAPATMHGQAGCGPGQFLDIGTGYCWSCPDGYNRTIFAVTGDTACERPAYSLFAGATRFNQAGCGPGQFFDIGTGYCWSCPEGYNRTVFSVTGSTACEKPAYSLFSGATQHGQPGCGAGQFFDLGTGYCWSCPSGYNRTIFAVTGSTACERPAYSEFLPALSTSGSGFFGTDCPSGYVFDFILRRCYACPEGSAKLVFLSWNDAGACERVIPAAYSFASRYDGLCPSGQFLDLSTAACWSCPQSYNRTVFGITAWNACERVFPATLSSATRYDGLCPQGQFWDLGTGYCWSCPKNYNRTIFAVTAENACEQVVPAQFGRATRYDGLCPSGQFWDIGTGYCWTCPSDYARTIFNVEMANACEKVIPAVWSSATRFGPFACEDRGSGWFLDVGRNECWSCEGWTRNLNPVDSPEACTGPPATFGDLVFDSNWMRPPAERIYSRRSEVSASFWAGHPKNVFGTLNDRRLDALSTFMEVQLWTGASWDTIRTDADWDTTFRWERVGIAASKATAAWKIGDGAEPGFYRIMHRGFSLGDKGVLTPYEGISPSFQVTE